MPSLTRSVLIVGLLGFAFCDGVMAEELSLDMAIGRIIRVSPSVKAADASIQSANDGLSAAKWARYPSLSFQAESRMQGSGNYPYTGNQAGGVAKVDMSLWTAGRISAEIDVAKLKVVGAELALEDSKEQTAIRVIGIWRNLVSSLSLIEKTSSAISRIEKFEDKLRRRIGAGLNAPVDLENVLNRKLQLEIELSSAKSQYALALARLKLQLSDQSGKTQDIQLMSLQTQLSNALFAHPGLDQLDFMEAVKQRPPFLKSLVEARVSELELKITESRRFPDVLARYQYQPAGGGVPSTEGLFLSLNYQVGSGLSTWSQISAAASKYLAMLSMSDSALKDGMDGLSSEMSDFSESKSRLEQSRAALETAKGIHDSSVRLFESGKRSVLDVIAGLRDLEASEKSLAPLEAQVIYSSHVLDVRLGKSFWQRQDLSIDLSKKRE